MKAVELVDAKGKILYLGKRVRDLEMEGCDFERICPKCIAKLSSFYSLKCTFTPVGWHEILRGPRLKCLGIISPEGLAGTNSNLALSKNIRSLNLENWSEAKNFLLNSPWVRSIRSDQLTPPLNI